MILQGLGLAGCMRFVLRRDTGRLRISRHQLAVRQTDEATLCNYEMSGISRSPAKIMRRCGP